ncbi:hypothetical protein [Desulfobacula sp.]|uniref:hypothetical protein n=4 Tax=Desulfobacula sp. TaxID=2593537 RepID=UPI0039B9C004
MKKITLTILAMILMVSFIPMAGQAQTITEMIAKPAPKMLCVVSSMYDDQSNYIFVNWKIANVDPGADPVDIYMYLKSTDTLENYFIKIDFLSLMMGKNIMDTITAVDYEAKFIDTFDLNSYIDNGDLVVEMFPVDVSMIPNINNGKYLIYLAVVDPKTDDVLSSTVDILMVNKPKPPGPNGPGPYGPGPNGPGPNDPYNDPNKPYDPNQYQNDPNQYQNDPNQYQNDPNQYQNDPNQYQNDPNQYQNDPNQYQNDPNQYQNDPNQYQNDPNQYQNDPNQYQNDPNQYQNDPNQYQNDPNQYQNDPNQYQNDPNQNQNDPNQYQNDPNQNQNPPVDPPPVDPPPVDPSA